MIMKKMTILISVWVLIISGCTKELKQEQSALLSQQKNEQVGQSKFNIPDQISFTRPALYPEGIVFDQFNSRFLVSSLTTGTIGAVTYDGTYTPFIQDAALPSTVGLAIDEARKQVLAAVSSLTANVAELGIYDLYTGSRIQLIDLTSLRPNAGHFANDVAVDPQGNRYVTDSFSPIIYKIDRYGNVSILFENEKYATGPGQFGFNGIEYNKDGFLIVAFSAGGKLLKIPVNDTASYREIQLDISLVSPDGLLISSDGKELIVVDNKNLSAPMEVLYLTSDDKWASATRVASFPTGLVTPTTVTSDGKDVFVLYAFLHKLFSNSGSPQTDFIIQKVPFENTHVF
jgi:sugar lactone lactonase YvrE